jgi:hypothetical protein
VGDLQAVESLWGGAKTQSQKHTIEELENKESEGDVQAGITKSQGNGLQAGLSWRHPPFYCC